MKTVTFLNIILVVNAVIVLTLALFTTLAPAKTDFTKLIVPVASLIGLSLIRAMQVHKQKTLNQLSAVRVNKF